METFTMTDQKGGATEIPIVEEPPVEKNIVEEKMEVSSSSQDVMSAPIDAPPQNTDDFVIPSAKPSQSSRASPYPLNMTKAQFEALIAGVSGAIAMSPMVQDKLADILPSFFNEMGKISGTGYAVTVLVIAVIFYFAKQFIMGRR
jgi:hypothetical protein